MVNGHSIYALADSRPVIIPVVENNPRIVITDGYHISKPVKLVYKDMHTYCFKVVCALNDIQLYAGLGLLFVLYLTGFFTGIGVIKALSFLPVVYLVLFYYLNRQDFFRLVPVIASRQPTHR